MRTPRLRALALAAALLFGLTACGGESGDTDEDSGAAGAGAKGSGRFPVTIEHALGTTVIPDEPKRVATVNWANDEVPLALGVVPVGMAKANFGDDDGDGVLPWTEDRLKELGARTPVLFDETDGIDFEAVADTRPDVILASYSGPTEQDYETLSRIALLVPRTDRVVLEGKEAHRTPAKELARTLGLLPRSPVTPEGITAFDLLTDLNQTRGTTIVMVLHDLDPAARYADRLIALASGRLHAAGTPEEVMTEDTVRAVYGMESRVTEDPVPGKPLVLPIGRHHSTATDAEAAAASSRHAAGSR